MLRSLSPSTMLRLLSGSSTEDTPSRMRIGTKSSGSMVKSPKVSSKRLKKVKI